VLEVEAQVAVVGRAVAALADGLAGVFFLALDPGQDFLPGVAADVIEPDGVAVARGAAAEVDDAAHPLVVDQAHLGLGVVEGIALGPHQLPGVGRKVLQVGIDLRPEFRRPLLPGSAAGARGQQEQRDQPACDRLRPMEIHEDTPTTRCPGGFRLATRSDSTSTAHAPGALVTASALSRARHKALLLPVPVTRGECAVQVGDAPRRVLGARRPALTGHKDSVPTEFHGGLFGFPRAREGDAVVPGDKPGMLAPQQLRATVGAVLPVATGLVELPHLDPAFRAVRGVRGGSP